jgi:hypothetical protein
MVGEVLCLVEKKSSNTGMEVFDSFFSSVVDFSALTVTGLVISKLDIGY